MWMILDETVQIRQLIEALQTQANWYFSFTKIQIKYAEFTYFIKPFTNYIH